MLPRLWWLAAISLAIGTSVAGPPPAPRPADTAGRERSLMVPLAELRVVLTLARKHIDQLVERRPEDGALAAYKSEGVETWVEWRTLRIAGVRDVGVGEDDTSRGVRCRYVCKVRAMHHRVWLPDRQAWSGWRDGSHPDFPQYIEVICQQGRWRSVLASGDSFSPPGERKAPPLGGVSAPSALAGRI